MAAWLVMFWGVLGVCAILTQAIVRVSPLAIEAMRDGLTTGQWVVFALWVAFMTHAEGYRGFHRRFSPRVVARAQHLSRHRNVWRVIFAPFFCMSLFGASRRGMIVARCVLVGIVTLVLLVRLLPQPWRGIVDAGVVVGLGVGLLSLAYFFVRALAGAPPAIDPDLPAGEGIAPGLPA